MDLKDQESMSSLFSKNGKLTTNEMKAYAAQMDAISRLPEQTAVQKEFMDDCLSTLMKMNAKLSKVSAENENLKMSRRPEPPSLPERNQPFAPLEAGPSAIPQQAWSFPARETIKLIELVRKPEIFDGRSPNPRKCIMDYIIAVDMDGWSETIAVKYLSTFLSGTALSWYETGVKPHQDEGSKIVSSQEEASLEEVSLIDFTDTELEQEQNKRQIGGPWSPEVANSILHQAIDSLTSTNSSTRPRKYQNEAQQVLQLLTGIEDPKVEIEQDISVSSDPDWYEDPDIIGNGHIVSPATMRKILDMANGINGQRRRSHSGIESLYPWYRPVYLKRFESRLERNGTRLDKLKKLDTAVLKNFSRARENLQPVHGRMLQRWARQQAVDLGLDDFMASKSWLYRFTRRNGIVSRKITVYTGRSEHSQQERIAQNIAGFLQSYSRESRKFGWDDIWNYDQTGFNYEPANLRTLSFKGERDTQLLIDNMNKHTHSYTVQPLISRSGRLFPKLLIVMQEPKGEFGPIVSANVRELERKYGNVEVYASKSGKLSSDLIERWYAGTLARAVDAVRESKMNHDEPGVLLLADSWSGHSKESQQADLLRLGAKLLKIPPLTTDRLQPLDVNYNRQLKIIYNRIIEEAFYQDIISNVTTREGIINLQSLLHNQFTAYDYRDMILWAWRNTDPSFNQSSLINIPPKMVNAIQFEFDASEKCSVDECDKHAFLKCSHCGKLLCLHHFLNRTCFHTGPVQRRGKRETCLKEEEAVECPSTDKTSEVEKRQDPPLSQVSAILGALVPSALGMLGTLAAAKIQADSTRESFRVPTRAPDEVTSVNWDGYGHTYESEKPNGDVTNRPKNRRPASSRLNTSRKPNMGRG